MRKEKGVPSEEIAFIHDAHTDLQKKELFAQVRAGTVRILIGSAAALSGSMAVAAVTVSVSGGTWDYGSNIGAVWSRFYHPTRDHHSSCKGLFGQMYYSGKTAAGVTSDAWGAPNSGGNRAWYGFDD